MANINEEHLKALKLGRQNWDIWRRKNDNIHPYLYEANLSGMNLKGYYLDYTNLIYAKLINVDLSHARLWNADLYGANLENANLTDTMFENARMERSNLHGVNLKGAWLHQANLIRANLEEANLEGANLTGANICEANLKGANLIGAIFDQFTISSKTDMSGALLWVDSEPVEYDYQDGTNRILQKYLFELLISIKLNNPTYIDNLIIILNLVSSAFFEYQRLLLLSSSDLIGDILTAACLEKLQQQKNEIVQIKKITEGSIEIWAIIFPLFLSLFRHTIGKNIENVWQKHDLSHRVENHIDKLFGSIESIIDVLNKLFNEAKGMVNGGKEFDLAISYLKERNALLKIELASSYKQDKRNNNS